LPGGQRTSGVRDDDVVADVARQALAAVSGFQVCWSLGMVRIAGVSASS